MKILFFLLFVKCFCDVVCASEKEKENEKQSIYGFPPYLGATNYKKYFTEAMKRSFGTVFNNYPKKIPTFVDDTYCK